MPKCMCYFHCFFNLFLFQFQITNKHLHCLTLKDEPYFFTEKYIETNLNFYPAKVGQTGKNII